MTFIKNICGTPLEGKRLLRLTYLDESGTSKNDPYTVVAGAMVHFDNQIDKIENSLKDIAEKHGLIENFGDDFYFHATDIWNGNGFFKRVIDDWPFEKRFKILEDLASIFVECELLIPMGFVRKEDPLFDKYKTPEFSSFYPTSLMYHVIAFSQCCASIEYAMRELFPDENTILVIESCPSSDKDLKAVLANYKNKKLQVIGERNKKLFPFKHIKEESHFTNKKGSQALQLADLASFIIRAYMTNNRFGRSQIEQLYGLIEPQFIWHPNKETGELKVCSTLVRFKVNNAMNRS